MKIAIVTDTHFGARNDSQLFIGHFMEFFDETFFYLWVPDEQCQEMT